MENDRHYRDETPKGFIHALKQLRPKQIHVPESVDNVILEAARRRLHRPAESPAVRWWDAIRLWPRWARGPMLAATCLLVAFLGFFLVRQNGPSHFALEDVNRDGRVDVLDAFQLARDLRSGASPPLEFDFNGDGTVSHADAAAVASVAVRLREEGRRL